MADNALRTSLLDGEQEIAPLRRRWTIAAVVDGILAIGIVVAAATSGSSSPAAAAPTSHYAGSTLVHYQQR